MSAVVVADMFPSLHARRKVAAFDCPRSSCYGSGIYPGRCRLLFGHAPSGLEHRGRRWISSSYIDTLVCSRWCFLRFLQSLRVLVFEKVCSKSVKEIVFMYLLWFVEEANSSWNIPGIWLFYRYNTWCVFSFGLWPFHWSRIIFNCLVGVYWHFSFQCSVNADMLIYFFCTTWLVRIFSLKFVETNLVVDRGWSTRNVFEANCLYGLNSRWHQWDLWMNGAI